MGQGAVQCAWNLCHRLPAHVTGTVSVLGMPYEQVPGDTVAVKRKNIFKSSVDNITAYKKHGFVMNVEAGELIVIPPGYLVVLAVSDTAGSTGLRWSIAGDAQDILRVRASLAAVLSSFPEMRNASTGMQPFHDMLVDDD